jgi:hypothetical protein
MLIGIYKRLINKIILLLDDEMRAEKLDNLDLEYLKQRMKIDTPKLLP